ncbi:glycosyltransferase family 2 protein [Aeromonas veronii]|uniref:glycosyltransferase family 2 protein n=1 Tax=Aeromonas veronii TaxID=654 RepID=UPI003D21906A
MLDLVIVLYNPCWSVVQENLKRIVDCDFINKIIYVDNSSESFSGFVFSDPKVHYIPLNQNFGIAHAQNVGIKISLVSEKSFAVVLFDQDSILDADLLGRLFDDYIVLHRTVGDRLAAIGPQIIDSFSGKKELSLGGVFKKEDNKQGFVVKREIIASGKVINKNVVLDIGLMDDSLFIDGVDHEWCWRAKSKGYEIYMSNNVSMVHTVGDARLKFLFITLRVASPVRMYYQVRNFFILFSRGYVPLYWKLRNSIGYFIKFIVFGFFTEDFQDRRKYMIQGFKDGLLRRTGKIN